MSKLFAIAGKELRVYFTTLVAWAGIGARFEILTKYEIGFVYEFALTDPGDDIWKDRVTFDFHVRW